MTTQPLPPSVAELRDIIAAHYRGDALNQLCALASRADPAPVADEAAIEKWNLGLVWDTNQLVYRLSHGDKETALRLMRAAPRNDDKLRKLREWLIAKNRMVFRESIEAWSFEDHVGPDGVVKEIDKLLAESPAGDAPCQTMNSSSAADADKSLPSQSPMGPQEMTHTSRSEIISGQSAPTVSTMETLRSEIRGLHVVLGKISQSLKMSGWTVPQDVVDRVRGLMAQNEQYRWMDKKLIADLNGDIDDLRARLQAAEAERAAAQKERDDASKIAMTANAEAVRYMKERDEAREGAAYTLVGKLDAMAKERDEATARWKSVSDKLVDSWSERDKLQDDLADAKADRSIRDAEADGRRIQDLTTQIAAAQKERDEERRKAAEHELNWRSVSDKLVDSWAERDNLQADLAAAKAESAKAAMEELEAIATKCDEAAEWWTGDEPPVDHSGGRYEARADERKTVAMVIRHRIRELRATQPQPKTAEPATVRQGDAILGQYMRAVDTCVDRSFDDIVMRELCRRMLTWGNGGA